MEPPTLGLSIETAHILFMDMVGFARLSIEAQVATKADLNTRVRNLPEFQRAEAEGELLCLDTGDGMALAFFRDLIL